MGHIGVKGLKHAMKGLTWDDSHSETRCCEGDNLDSYMVDKYEELQYPLN